MKVCEEIKSSIWATASWSVSSPNTRPWIRVSDMRSHTCVMRLLGSVRSSAALLRSRPGQPGRLPGPHRFFAVHAPSRRADPAARRCSALGDPSPPPRPASDRARPEQPAAPARSSSPVCPYSPLTVPARWRRRVSAMACAVGSEEGFTHPAPCSGQPGTETTPGRAAGALTRSPIPWPSTPCDPSATQPTTPI